MKRGQITLYVTIALVVIIAFAMVLYTQSRSKEDFWSKGQTQDMFASQESVSAFFDSCIEDIVIDSIKRRGLDPATVAGFIEYNIMIELPHCLDGFSEFESQGYDITEGDLDVDVEVNPETILVEVYMPVRFDRADGSFNFESRSFTFQRTVTEQLDPDRDTIVVSSDGDVMVKVPAGTLATVNGVAIDEIGIKLEDKQFLGLNNGVIPGQVAYLFTPHNAHFSQPIEVIMYYDPKYFDYGMSEEDLSFAFWDPYFQVWWGLPTVVDKDKDKLTSWTNHFSFTGQANCPSHYETTQTGVLAQHDCEPCDIQWYNGQAESCPTTVGNCFSAEGAAG